MKKLSLLIFSVVLVAAFAGNSHALTLTEFTGDDAEVILNITGEGTTEVVVEVSLGTGTIADIRGVFFDFTSPFPEDLQISGDDVTGWALDTNNLGHGNNVKPLNPFDVGIEIGTQGIGGDDIRFTTFTMTSSSLIDFGGTFAARLTSVGPNREGSSKLTNSKPPPPYVIPEPTTIFLVGLGLLGLAGLRKKSS